MYFGDGTEEGGDEHMLWQRENPQLGRHMGATEIAREGHRQCARRDRSAQRPVGAASRPGGPAVPGVVAGGPSV